MQGGPLPNKHTATNTVLTSIKQFKNQLGTTISGTDLITPENFSMQPFMTH